MDQRARVGWAGRRPPQSGGAVRRAVDLPAFWWTAGAIFLVNAVLSAAAGNWLLAALQTLTSVWAAVAGVTAGLKSPDPPATAAVSLPATGTHGPPDEP